jgi:hypothetical protein
MTSDIGSPNKYVQTITLAPNTGYYISAYLWTFSENFDITLAEVIDPSVVAPASIGKTISLTANASTANDTIPPLIDGSRGVFAYGFFNSSIFSASPSIQVEVEFDFDEFAAAHTLPLIAGQIDNVAITPFAEFQAPQAVPEPASLSMLGIGAAGLLRRRRM